MNFPEHPRYSAKSFPPYRFIPGATPHPTENPQGHSYGRREDPVENFDPQLWQNSEHYLYGADLYNHGYWWESHEAWEGLWGALAKNDPISHYLQGLIQISAAFIKWNLCEKRGVIHLYHSAMKYLILARDKQEICMGLDLEKHIRKLDHHFKEVISDPAVWPDPTVDFPYVVLSKINDG